MDAELMRAGRLMTDGVPGAERKRHLLTATLGLLLTVLVTPASTTDRDAARILLSAARDRFGRLTRIWADGGTPATSSTGVRHSSESVLVLALLLAQREGG
ncbi:transposase [Streptomyces sp. NPDC053086]|uniref:transposase n=1 Tax=unclassified Streptomyces TaxID=2593676 RepID=UPI0037D4978D